MEELRVELDSRSYTIHIGENLRHDAGKYLSALSIGKKTMVITDTNVAPLYLSDVKNALLKSSFEVHEIILPEGEEQKNLSTVESIYTELSDLNIDRNCSLIALGGGVAGDITGFAASTYFRGVPYVQIPTTLLSQVDSSVGGKTGVNMAEGKNMVGTFYQPSMVLIDIDTLNTLDTREFLAGMAEVVKYAIIQDGQFFSWLYSKADSLLRRHSDDLIHIIKTCCMIKADIVSKDETEKGIRAFLNFGHTFGHAVETLTGYGAFKHGEAVAMGMAAAARLSYNLGICTRDAANSILSLIKRYGMLYVLPDFPAKSYMEVIRRDKKNREGSIRMVLLEDIGSVCVKELGEDRLREELGRILQ